MNLNQNAFRLLEKLDIPERHKIRLKAKHAITTILDAGVLNKKQDLETSLAIAEAATGGLAGITAKNKQLKVAIPHKVALATLGCQMAGWAIPVKNGCAMASGPARILARKPNVVFRKLKYEEESQKTALILETERLPDEKTLGYIARETKARDIIIAAFKGDTKTGLINVLARVVELAVYRLNYLGYDINKIHSAEGTVRIPKTTGMCEANDAVIYHSRVKLKVTEWDDALTEKCTSKSAACYGKKFKEIYQQAGHDFYKIDPAIYAPAEVEVKER